MGSAPTPQPLLRHSTIAIAEGTAGRQRGGRRVLDPLILRRHKLRNAAHTVLLVGGMGAVLAALAWVLFGAVGVVWAVVLGGVALAVRPTVPPRWVLSMYGARPLHPRTAPELHRLVAVLADRAALPTVPVLHYVPTTTPNAFAVGRPDDAAIAVTDGLLRRLTRRELVGVLAHEISHIRSDDLRIMSLSDTIGRVTQILACIGVLLVLLTLPLTAGGTSAPLWFAVILTALPTVVMLLQLALSRSREYDSDLEAAMLTGDPDGLARALEQLERADERIWERLRVPHRRTPDPFLLRTHPPMSERTRRLRELAGRDDRQRLGDARHIPPAGYPQVKPPQASSCPSGYDALVRDARELPAQRESDPGGRQAGPTATPRSRHSICLRWSRWRADRAMACPETGEVSVTNAIASRANVMIAAFSVATDEARTASTPGPVARPWREAAYPGYEGIVTTSQLVRPHDGKWIAGVCAGLADRFGLSRGLVRILFVIFGLIGAGELAYIILWILIPKV